MSDGARVVEEFALKRAGPCSVEQLKEMLRARAGIPRDERVEIRAPEGAGLCSGAALEVVQHAPQWKLELDYKFRFLMRLCRLDGVAALDQRICALNEELTLLEERERAAWEGLVGEDSCAEAHEYVCAIGINRRNKCFEAAIQQCEWGEDYFSKSTREICIKVWMELKEKQEERDAFKRLRSFYQERASNMNLDNCLDMGNWELVCGGDTGRNTASHDGRTGLHRPGVGVFKAKGDRGKIFAVKCVRPDDNTPEAIQRMKGEVDSHSILLHPCILQYSGDYTESSSHFLKFFLKNPQSLKEFSDTYSQNRHFLYIVSEFCGGGSIVQYVHGFHNTVTTDATHMTAEALGLLEFESPCSHHLHENDYIVIFPPTFDDHPDNPYLAQVVSISDCPFDPSLPQRFTVRHVADSEPFVQMYIDDLNEKDNYPLSEGETFHFHYVCFSGTFICSVYPRPSFFFLQNFCFQAIHALQACYFQSVYHGDIRLENFFVRKVIEVDDILGRNRHALGVQLGDFDLATADKDRKEEFKYDRCQLVVALLLLVGGSQYGCYREVPRSRLQKCVPLESILSQKCFCRHLPEHCIDQFANLLRGLWDVDNDSSSPTFGSLLQLPFFSSVYAQKPDVDISESNMDISLYQSGFAPHWLGPHDGSDGSDINIIEVQHAADEIISSIRSIEQLCLPRDFHPDDFSCEDCACKLAVILKAMQTLVGCDGYDDNLMPLQRENCKGFLREDKKPMLVHPEACKVFLRSDLCGALGCAVEKLIEVRERLASQLDSIEKKHQLELEQACAMQDTQKIVQHFVGIQVGTEEQVLRSLRLCDGDAEAALNLLTADDDLIKFSDSEIVSRKDRYKLGRSISEMARFNAHGMIQSHHERIQRFFGLLRQVDVIESLIVVILEQCAVHKRKKSMMYFSSNESLVSFLSKQVDNPNQKVGTNVSLSLFVQLFSYSIPDPDLVKLGGNRPIFDTQTKLESLNTHVLVEKVQKNRLSCSSSVVERIFEYASDLLLKMQSSTRDQQSDITSSEQNLEYSLRALVNISLSYRWCTENGVIADVYTSAQPCVSCQLNTVTMKFIRKLLPLKKLMPKLRSLGKFDARLSLLISDWWHRIERPHRCSCNSGIAVGYEELKDVKKIVSAPFLNLANTPKIAPSLVRRLSDVQSPALSPIVSPKVDSPTAGLQKLSSLDIGLSHVAYQNSSLMQQWKQRKNVTHTEQSPGNSEVEKWSSNWMSPPQTPSPKPALPAAAPKQSYFQRVLMSLRSWQCGLHFPDDGSNHEYDLTELDADFHEFDDNSADIEAHLSSIMKAASETLNQNCPCECFVFVTCRGRDGRHLKDLTTTFCCDELISHNLTRVHKEDQCSAGKFRLHFDQSRNVVILSVYPRKQERKGSIARTSSRFEDIASTAKDCWVAVDSSRRQHKLWISSNGQSPQERIWRAAVKFSKMKEFKSQTNITVELLSENISETFNVAELFEIGEKGRKSSKGHSKGSGSWRRTHHGKDSDACDAEDA